MVKTLSEENFSQEVLNNSKTVLVDFWADWCGPCKMMSPIVDEIAEENEEFTVGKVNVDECPNLAAHYRISAIPTIIVFKNGFPAATVVGFRPKDELLKIAKEC